MLSLNTKNKIIKFIKAVETEYQKNWLYLLITRPQVYLTRVFYSTLFVGIFTFVISYLYIHSSLYKEQIPATFHSLLGIVIGLLLVFRTNTSYDRWWDGSKNMANISSNINFFLLMLESNLKNNDNEAKKKIKHNLKVFTENLGLFLYEIERPEIKKYQEAQFTAISNILNELNELRKKSEIDVRDLAVIEKSISEIMLCVGSCEKIRSTPIPISYLLHIKISIFIYILTLPFGLFHDLGLWAVPLVMIVFYIIAGIEIISNEIENPFRGDPNDLPIQSMIADIDENIDKCLKTDGERQGN